MNENKTGFQCGHSAYYTPTAFAGTNPPRVACATCHQEVFPFGDPAMLVNKRTPSLLSQAVTEELNANLEATYQECQVAMRNWPAFHSAHEGYGVLLEEVDELWDHVKTNQKRRDITAMKKECIQVAAMALRFATEICNEEMGRK